MLRMTEGLLDAGHAVRILAVSTDKHPWYPEKIPGDFRAKTNIDAFYVNTNVRWLPAFLSLFKTSSYNIDRFYNFGFEAKLTEILARDKFDIVQLESLYMCPYIPVIRRLSNAKIVLRAHNVESAIWQKNANEENDAFKKLWFKDLAGKLERYEVKVINEVDAIVPITDEDKKRLKAMGTHKPMHTATFAMKSSTSTLGSARFDMASNLVITSSNTLTAFHIGAMDWKPNYDGVKWLTEIVWPIVLKKVPNAELHLAGKGMNIEEFSGMKNVIAHGEVPDAQEFMSAYNVMVVPLHGGGGVKVKMIEGMFAGKPIVTTPIGAEGIDGNIGTDYFVALTAAEFASKIIELLESADLANKMGASARNTAIENHDLKRVSEKLSDFYRSIVAK